MACNRDESRHRPAALPPQRMQFGTRQALLPIDPVSEGTWIAVNDAGLMMTLLNYYPQPHHEPRDPTLASRGSILPALLAQSTLDDASRAAQALLDREFPPFRLVLASLEGVVDMAVYHAQRTVHEHPFPERPIMFTSSGLGDDVVARPRGELFRVWFREPDAWPEQQETFHRHSWPDRQHVSVCMRRPDACTLSYTVVDLTPTQATMTYLAGPPDENAERTTLSLVLTG